MQKKQLSGSEKIQSIGVRASNNKNPESEDKDNPLKASDMKELKYLAKSLYQNEVNLEDETIASEDDYHMVTGANRQLHIQIAQHLNFYTTRQGPTQAKIYQLQRKNSLSQITKSQNG